MYGRNTCGCSWTVSRSKRWRAASMPVRAGTGRTGASTGTTCSPVPLRRRGELLLTLLDGPPGGQYVEGRDDRPWLDPAA